MGFAATEIWRMCADNTIATRELNWKPEISFEDGLTRTVDWFKKYVDVFYSSSSSLNQL